MIPINERHLKSILNEFVIFYNRGRPHMSLGPGIPACRPPEIKVPADIHGHAMPANYRVGSTSVLGGLHYEYHLKKEAA